MRLSRAVLAFLPMLVLSGCGYVHFGRLPALSGSGDGSVDGAYSNLSTQHKILQQELAIARKEGEALRAALESHSGGSPELATRLTETTRELAALRASYAKLNLATSSPVSANAGDPTHAAQLAETEERLAASLRNYTQLQEENVRLRHEVDQTRADNTALTAQVKTITAENFQAQSALAQLNSELLAQKEARARAEQQTDAAHAQLRAVVAMRDPASNPPTTLAGARETSAPSTVALSVPGVPSADRPATGELHTSPERLRAVAEKSATSGKSSSGRRHVVVSGDTLAIIAEKYYGDPSKWALIYAANTTQFDSGRPLQPGMELEIPEK